MEIREYIKNYCKENKITFRDFLIERKVHPCTFSNYREKFTIGFLLKFDDILNDKPEFREMIAKRIKHKLVQFTEFDVRSIPNEVIFEIYEILKEYKNKD